MTILKIQYLSENKIFFTFEYISRWAFIVLFQFFIIQGLFAQNQLLDKTFEDAHIALEEKNIHKAVSILRQFEEKYPGDANIERLYAQTLIWIQDYEKSKEIYERALSYHPNNKDVRIEYAIMLMDIGDYPSAKDQLNFVLKSSPQNGYANFVLGKLLYYEGHFIQSYNNLELALKQHPQNKEIADLKNQVYQIIRPKLLVKALHRSDQQPLSKSGSIIKFNYFKSNIFNFGAEASSFFYSNIPSNNLISTIKLSNNLQFIKQGIKIKLAAGIIHSQNISNSQFIADFSFSKTFNHFVSVNFDASRNNYDYTSISAGDLLMVSNLKLNIALGDPNSFNGLVGSQYTFFPDQNMVYSYYLWALSKPINFSRFKFIFGYSLNHMNSIEDRFEPNKSLDEVLLNPEDEISGIYIPYYTPIDLWSNSILLKLQYQISEYYVINTHASVGVYSNISVPYHYIDVSASDQIVFAKGFIKQQYLPLDIGLDFNAVFSKNIEMKFSYNYLSTYYFTSHFIDLGFVLHL